MNRSIRRALEVYSYMELGRLPVALATVLQGNVTTTWWQLQGLVTAFFWTMAFLFYKLENRNEPRTTNR